MNVQQKELSLKLLDQLWASRKEVKDIVESPNPDVEDVYKALTELVHGVTVATRGLEHFEQYTSNKGA